MHKCKQKTHVWSRSDLDVSGASETLELSVDHDAEPIAEGLAFLHAALIKNPW